MAPAARVLVIDDSVVVRRVVQRALDGVDGIEVVGTATDGRSGVAKVDQLTPDLVTLDIEMPVMDGLEALGLIRRSHPRLPVIMFSTLTQRGAAATLDALSLGASDYLTKPSQMGSMDNAVEHLREELVPRILALTRRVVPPPVTRPAPASRSATTPRLAPAPATTPAAPARRPRPAPVGARPSVVAIGVSTGGPNALNDLIPALPATLGVPVLVVQHMPPLFTKILADRLDSRSPLRVTEAAEGDEIRAGGVWIAPGGHHLVVRKDGPKVTVGITDDPPENSCRPAVDPLFRSVSEVFDGRVLGVVLTGMGQDGLRGAEAVRAAGGVLVAQDEASSVVWGMPGYVVRAGLADAVVPLDGLATEIVRRVSAGSPPRAAAGHGPPPRPTGTVGRSREERER